MDESRLGLTPFSFTISLFYDTQRLLMVETSRKPVIVFDGECSFCRRQIDRVRRKDRHELFEYAARQTPGLEDRFPALADSDFNTGMRLIEPDERLYVGADALYEITRRLKPWKWIAWIYRIPGLTQLFRAIYAWIAANRHRLGGRCENDACDEPPPGSD